MYKLMATISIVIRQFYIPNPFEALGEGLKLNIGGTCILLSPNVMNWIAEAVIHIITFWIVGLYYDRGSDPSLGSFLYFWFYCVHIFLLWVLSLTGFATWAIALIVVLYVGCHIGLKRLRSA